MQFKSISFTQYTASQPPAPVIVQAVGFYIILLDSKWIYPAFIEWSIEYRTSNDNLSWGDWTFSHTVSNGDTNTQYMTVDPRCYYQFRYNMRTKQELSPYSIAVQAGKPKVLMPDEGHTTTYIYTIGEYTDS